METSEWTPTMTVGTEGHDDYGVYARRGNISLSLKPLGPKMILPGVVTFAARVRSSPIDPGVAVMPSGLLAAWPKIEFEKADSSRASEVIIINVQGSPDIIGGLIESYIEAGVGAKMVEHMRDGAGDGADHEDGAAFAKWIDDAYLVMLREVEAKQAGMTTKIENASNTGAVVSQSSLMKALYGSKGTGEVNDDDSPDDGDGV